MVDYNIIKKHGDEIGLLIQETTSIHYKTIYDIADYIISALQNNGKVIIFGNGGSYADSLHFAAELEGAYRNRKRRGLAAIVPSNPASLTAISNDFSYEYIFQRFIESAGLIGDVAIGLSTSGNSINVARALRYAKEKGIKTVAFTGASGGIMKEHADILLNIPSKDTPRIQEAQHFAYHEICDIVEQEMFRD